ncbi:MFS transporter [Alginatibacterium sediminis]|uniref:MFS transporter n=1 Tax=Alginatibacterium sediminis TaxID=2164068 RepID=A0A420E727_9ALTE|nr:MFS transporter [Alginatibacterium sediminis]RKF14316.1 MFS transporter [Alginatibacterium sediminis]
MSETSLFQRQRLSRFNITIWTVLSGTLLARTSYFMAWPFLVVFLYQDYGVSATDVGFMLGGSALIASVTGLYSGYLSDIFGRKRIMVMGSLIAALAYAGIGFATQLWQFYLLVMMAGLMRPMIEAPAKATIGDQLKDSLDRELALNIRYFLINLGGALGPLIGITLALKQPQTLFIITGLTYVVYGIWLMIGLDSGKPRDEHASVTPSFFRTLAIIAKDRIFVWLMVANFLMMFVYAQIESSIPQVIVRSGVENAAALIAGLVLVNTLTIVIFQFPLLKLTEKLPLFTRTKIGMGLMGVAQLGFFVNPGDSALSWIIASFVLSLGEVIAFPTLNVQVDKLAPDHLRGSYFGASALYAMGFSLAPIVGGLVIDHYDADWLFVLCAGLCGLMYVIYTKVQKLYTDLPQS